MLITMAHGSGGRETEALVRDVFLKHFRSGIIGKLEDAAVIDLNGRAAFTTDSFVVTPLFFLGGDIGRLAVCGTVNDLLMMGASPKYLSAGFIIEEGMETETLVKIAASMAEAAAEAGVEIAAGDTKVIQGKGGLYINTAGIGIIPEGRIVSPAYCRAGDAVICSGNLGDHHACILSARLNIQNGISSDAAPLNGLTGVLFQNGIRVKAMRDITRGGLATVLNELCGASGTGAVLYERSLPVAEETAAFCGVLGLDPLTMGNEGKFVAVVAKEDAAKAVAALKGVRGGENAAVIGEIRREAGVALVTKIGGRRRIDALYGEGLPRIC
jgi:hydrogenase expression/formation protein HypE